MRTSILAYRHMRASIMLSVIVVATIIAASPAHAQSSAQDPSARAGVMEKSIQSGAKGAPEEAAGNKVSTADSTLMRELAKANLAEIKMSGLALSLTENQAIRSLAQRLLNDHGQAMDELRKLATAKGVILPGGVEKEQVAVLRQLALLAGDEFDRRYLEEAGINSHGQAVKLFEDAVARARDPDLKAYASKYLPVINQHLHMGQKMHKGSPPSASNQSK